MGGVPLNANGKKARDEGLGSRVRLRVQIAAVGSIAIVIVGVALWRRGGRQDAPAATSEGETQVPATRSWPAAAFRLVDPPPVAPDELPDPDRPIVDQLWLDKDSVCRGEENFINVKARTSNGTDAFVGIRFDDPTTGHVSAGTRIPFRLQAPPARELTVFVEGKGGAAQVVALPPIEVKDCVAPRQITIESGRNANSPDRLALTARVTESAPDSSAQATERFVPVAYEWDFGDGTVLTGTDATIEHSYEGRDQTVVQSSFLVTVKARDSRGNEAKGSRALWLPNLAFAPLVAKGRVVVSVGVKDADPTTATPERIWLYHGYPHTVRLERVSLRETVLDPGAATERETFRKEFRPAELLGFSELPPHQSLTTRDLGEFQPKESAAVRIVEVVGRTADDKPVRAVFTLLPPKGETATNEGESHDRDETATN
jgi:hypothetical protein